MSRTLRTRAPLDLLGAALWTLAAVAAALADAPVAVLVLLGMPLVLLLPGLGVLSVTHPASRPALEGARPVRALAWPDRFLLAVPLSVAAAAVTGVVLDGLPGGLTPASAAIALGLFTLLALGIGLAVRLADTRPEQRPIFQATFGVRRPAHEWVSVLALAATLGLLAVATATFVSDSQDDGYVSLFIEPDFRVECYPLRHEGGLYAYNATDRLCPGAPSDIGIVANNHLGRGTPYTLRVVWSERPDAEARRAGDVVVKEMHGRLDALPEGEGLAHQLRVPLPLDGAPPFEGLQYLKVQLFLDRAPGPTDAPAAAVQLRVLAA
ncbi:MAG: DUF1616 domain-containing protein [Thermoplasmatota archaeon]